MKTNTQKKRKAESGKRESRAATSRLRNPQSAIRTSQAFTLIELLVVISIMGFSRRSLFPVTGAVKRQQYLKTATAEMEQIETALDNYKAKYGFYPPEQCQQSFAEPALL